MSDRKTERQLNLLFLLLNAVKPIEREEIRKRIPGYFDKTNEAFERMFERDKEDLRELGIPIETVSIDIFHEDIFGYQINQDSWLMPEIVLTPSERALLNLASAAWSKSQLSSALTEAVKRLSDETEFTYGVDFELTTQSDHVENILLAISQEKCVTFGYYSINSNSEKIRNVAPWRVFFSNGHSYLIGFDQDRGEERVFKLSRITNSVSISNEEIIEKCPDGLSAREYVTNWQSRNKSTVEAVLKITKNAAGDIRLLANSIEYGDDFDVISISNLDIETLANLIAKNCDVVQDVQPKGLAILVEQSLSMVLNEK